MNKTAITTLLTALTLLSPCLSQAHLTPDCDPKTEFCIFIQADKSFVKEHDVKTRLGLNRWSLEYPGEIRLSATTFETVSLPAQLLEDARIHQLSFEVKSIDNQIMSKCEITTDANITLQPGLHVITLSEKQNEETTEFHCKIEQ